MNLLGGLTDQPKQTIRIVLEDGSAAVLSLRYSPNQVCWFFDVEHGTFLARGMQLTASPNVLHQFRLEIPFGIAVLGAGDLDPVDQESFINGSTSVYLLDAAEVAEVESAAFDPDA